MVDSDLPRPWLDRGQPTFIPTITAAAGGQIHIVMNVFTLSVLLVLLLLLGLQSNWAEEQDAPDSLTFIFLVGLEGTGHHFMQPLINEVTWACKRHFSPNEDGNMFSIIEKMFWDRSDVDFR